MNKIKVLQITHDLKIGGLQRVVVDLATNLNKDKFSVSVCVLREGGPLEKELSEADIEVIRMPPAMRPDYFRFWKLANLMAEIRPHIVHTHNTEPLTDGVPAALLAGVPVKIHTDHARSFPDKMRYMFSEWALSHFVTQFVAVSEQTKADLVKYEKISPHKIRVVLNGINGASYDKPVDREQVKARLGIDASRGPIIGIAARLTWQKGLHDLLEATKLLQRDFPQLLVLIAGEGELWESLHSRSKELGIEANVSLLGRRSDVPEILQVLDVFVLPSLFEGLPLVVLEAMAASLPVVATDVGGVRQAVQDGITGLIVPPGSPPALSAAIRTILNSSDMRNEFARNARMTFLKAFSLTHMVKAYEAMYSDSLVCGRA